MRTILCLAIVALLVTSSCSSSDSSSDSGSELPAEAERVIRDYLQAYEEQDVDAWYATVTDDYFYRQYIFGAEKQNLWTDWLYEDDANDTAYRIVRGSCRSANLGPPRSFNGTATPPMSWSIETAQ